MKELLVKAGDIIKLHEIPFRVKADVVVETAAGNYQLFLSHEAQSSLNPCHAYSPDNAATSNSSFTSI